MGNASTFKFDKLEFTSGNKKLLFTWFEDTKQYCCVSPEEVYIFGQKSDAKTLVNLLYNSKEDLFVTVDSVVDLATKVEITIDRPTDTE